MFRVSLHFHDSFILGQLFLVSFNYHKLVVAFPVVKVRFFAQLFLFKNPTKYPETRFRDTWERKDANENEKQVDSLSLETKQSEHRSECTGSEVPRGF